MSELVSIVIPAFNTEHEIEKCIEALVQQTYLNYEVILINDGSTDNTAAICDSLAEKNDKIVVIHQENAGVSSARNAGLKLARGKWIVFLDADDHMAPEAIEKALMLAEEQNCDTVCWNCFSECDGEVKEYPSIRPNGGIYQGKEMKCVLTEALYYTRKESFYPGMMFRAVWGKLLSADVIRKNAIMFPVGLPLGEDAAFLADYFHACQKVLLVNQYWNYYRVSADSAVGKYKPNIRQLQLQELDTIMSRLSLYEMDMDTILLNQYLQFDYQYVHNLSKKNNSILFVYREMVKYIQERDCEFKEFSSYDMRKIPKKSIPVALAITKGFYHIEACLCVFRGWRHR